MSVSNIGNLMCLSMDKINLEKSINIPEFLVKASAKKLIESGGRNWVPVIVAEIEEDKYKVIGNSFVYAIAEEAQLERVWCIVTDNSERTFQLTKVLAGESVPKINLSTARRDEIQAALQYLIEKPNSEMTGVKLSVATNRIEEAPRKSWTTLEPITRLRCGITKGKKLDALKEIFYLTPQSTPEVVAPEAAIPETNAYINLNSLTLTQLKDMAKKQGFSGLGKKKKQELVALLTTS